MFLQVIYKDKVLIPTAFGKKASPHTISKTRIILALLMQLAITIIELIILLKTLQVPSMKYLLIIIWLLAGGLIRNLYLHEKYFLKQYELMSDHQGIWNSELSWNCYDSDKIRDFTVYRLKDNRNVILIQFYKDVIIGKGANAQARHHDAISEAYRLLAHKKIEFMHVDYMGSVGNDPRFDYVVKENLSDVKDNIIKDLISHIYKFIKFEMNKSFANYDVYAFFYKEDDYVFLDKLKDVLEKFMLANYIGFSSIAVDDVPDLIKYLYPYPEFAVDIAKSQVYATTTVHKHIKLIRTYDSDNKVIQQYNLLKSEQEQQALSKQNRKKHK